MIKSIDNDACVSCGHCVQVCTKDVLRWDEDEKHPYIAYGDECQTCFNCLMHCMGGAISIDPKCREDKIYCC